MGVFSTKIHVRGCDDDVCTDTVSTPFSLSFFFFGGKENSGNFITVGALCVMY
jgi:hypothetical protein